MSAGQPLLTERELDAILGDWFADGAVVAPDRVAERAISAANETPQIRRRWPIAPLLQPAWAWAVILVALAFGAFVVSELVDDDRNPAPTPEPSPTIALELVEDEAWQMLVPVGWVEVDDGYGDVRSWVGDDGEVRVTVGEPIGQGQIVHLCAPPIPDYEACLELRLEYSFPLRDEEHIGPVPRAGAEMACTVRLRQCDSTASAISLGGEPGGQEQFAFDDRMLTYVSAFHRDRPVIVYWSQPARAARSDLIAAMLASFAFTTPAASAEDPSTNPSELVRYTNDDAGFSILLPRAWAESAENLSLAGQRFGGVQKFGRDTWTIAPLLTVSVGQPGGSVYSCKNICTVLDVQTVRDLDELLVSTPVDPEGTDSPPDENGETTLGGEPARFERPGKRSDSMQCVGCAWTRYHVYAIRDGRPIILSFDWWMIEGGRLDETFLETILDSFELTS